MDRISCLFWIAQYSPQPVHLRHQYPLFVFVSQAPALGPVHYPRDYRCSEFFHRGCCCYTTSIYCSLYRTFCILCPSCSSHPPLSSLLGIRIRSLAPVFLLLSLPCSSVSPAIFTLLQCFSFYLLKRRYRNGLSVSPSIFTSTLFRCFPIVIDLAFSTLILKTNL